MPARSPEPCQDSDDRPAPDERRREERFRLPVDVELWAPSGVPEVPEIGVLRDVSTNGIGLELDRPVRVGDVVTCKLLDTPADLPCEYCVEILWQRRGADGKFLCGGRIVNEPT